MKKSKNTLIYLIISSLFIGSFVSCTGDYDEINTDKSKVQKIGPAELPFLFTRAIAAVPFFNDQVAQNLYSDLYAQYFANLVAYFPTDRYVMEMDWIDSPWSNIYTGVVPQLQAVFENTDPSSPENAIAHIWWVYAFHKLTDYFGPIPYFQAGVPGISVAYDSQEAIYADFFVQLNDAVAILKNNTDKQPYGNYDIVYNGDVEKWIKFANSLRLRLALRLSKVDPAKAKSEAEQAVASGVFTKSPDDDALRQHNNNDPNRMSSMTTYDEFRMSAAMESVLKGFDDPRMPEYFLPAKTTGTYEGARNGYNPIEVAIPQNLIAANSHVGPRWTRPDDGGLASYLTTPSIVMCAAEVYFLRAEGAYYGWNMGAGVTVKELYEEGIKNSMIQFGIDDAAAIQAYINNTNKPIPPQDYLNSPALLDVPVLFSTVSEIQLQQIALQKWLALFPDGWEAWSDYRRLKAFDLYPVVNSDHPDIPDPTTQAIRRLVYPLAEKETNGGELTKGITLLGGENKITTPLWWDKN